MNMRLECATKSLIPNKFFCWAFDGSSTPRVFNQTTDLALESPQGVQFLSVPYDPQV